jgi:hypothetical protein
MADEFDKQKDEIFARWQAAGVAPSGLNSLWELARICRENDHHMDTIVEAGTEIQRKAAFQAFWNARGVHYSALSYIAEQRVIRALSMSGAVDLRTGTDVSEDLKSQLMITWMDGLATGIEYRKFDFTNFFPILDGSLTQGRK